MKQEQKDALDTLRQWLKPGDNVYTFVRHVSKSGMSHCISLHIVREGGIRCIDWYAAKALERKQDANRGGIKIGGGGMDMSFALVYELGRVLFPEGFEVNPPWKGRNGDNSGWDKDGGYALNRIHM